MQRIVGIETEYGCLVSGEPSRAGVDQWPALVRRHLFQEQRAGVIDRHYRDYEEPPGNGGFLLNGGRVYIDMGHLEYATPECRTLHDLVRLDIQGDRLVLRSLQACLEEKEAEVAFLKNNIDHYTGATFGSHENYLVNRNANLDEPALRVLLSFLATRQIFTGAGRIGQAASPQGWEEMPEPSHPVRFQLSQRADHIVNDIYQWVQFNRAIINARDEPLADYRRFRRLHLLLGDSNMSPWATALKVGTTDLMLTLVERELLRGLPIIEDAVEAMRLVSHDPKRKWEVPLLHGGWSDAVTLQMRYLELAETHLAGSNPDADWALSNWRFALEALAAGDHVLLLGGVDWVTKEWMLTMFAEEQGLDWDDPWLSSLDLAYHDINPAEGLFYGAPASGRIAKFNEDILGQVETIEPPADTRAQARAELVERIQRESILEYVINWDSAEIGEHVYSLPDPFESGLPQPTDRQGPA